MFITIFSGICIKTRVETTNKTGGSKVREITGERMTLKSIV